MRERLMIIINLMALELCTIQEIKFVIRDIGRITNLMGLDIYSIIFLRNKRMHSLSKNLLYPIETLQVPKLQNKHYGSIMKDNSRTMRKMDLGYYFLLTEANLKVNLYATKLQAQDHS